jgi:hypothetical protein
MRLMEVQIGYLKNVVINESRDSDIVTIQMNEMDGSHYGTWNNEKMPAKAYEVLERAVVDHWLEKQKSI